MKLKYFECSFWCLSGIVWISVGIVKRDHLYIWLGLVMIKLGYDCLSGE